MIPSEEKTTSQNIERLDTQSIQQEERPKTWLVIGLTILVVISLSIAGVFAYQNYQLKKQIVESRLQITPAPPTPTPTPRQITIDQTEKPTIQPITIPSDWQEFTETDYQAGLTTTLSVPPGYHFRFTGSEWDLGKFNEENWDYSTSILFDEEGNPKNEYGGGSRRLWYQRYLDDEFFHNVPPIKRGEVVSVKEHSVGPSTCLEVTVDNPFTGKLENHYLYVQNDILHIIKPLSGKANSPDSTIAKNIAIIFASLKSSFVK